MKNGELELKLLDFINSREEKGVSIDDITRFINLNFSDYITNKTKENTPLRNLILDFNRNSNYVENKFIDKRLHVHVDITSIRGFLFAILTLHIMLSGEKLNYYTKGYDSTCDSFCILLSRHAMDINVFTFIKNKNIGGINDIRFYNYIEDVDLYYIDPYIEIGTNNTEAIKVKFGDSKMMFIIFDEDDQIDNVMFY